MPMFGYARVSTRDQDFNAQVAELMAAGCAKVYREKASGAKWSAPLIADSFRQQFWQVAGRGGPHIALGLDSPGRSGVCGCCKPRR